MTVYRLPVVKSLTDRTPIPDQLPPPLQCIDFGANGLRNNNVCKAAFLAHLDANFSCPGKCRKGSWLYPRKAYSDGHTHYHQGIDVGAPKGSLIISVTEGIVCHAVTEFQSGFGGYGRTVVVESPQGFHILYAHCLDVLVEVGQEVVEQQPIATVGMSSTASYKQDGKTLHVITDASKGFHLHMEVSRTRYGKDKFDEETKLENELPPRETQREYRDNPLAFLESLGPWGMSQAYWPIRGKVKRADATDYHQRVEQQQTSGYFPLGANNFWHGGVHLQVPRGTDLVAPFDGTLIAARIDPDPERAMGAQGHTNFILLRHEISALAFERLQGHSAASRSATAGASGSSSPKRPKKTKAAAVGRHGSNEPEHVLEVKRLLHQRLDSRGQPYYAPMTPGPLPALDQAKLADSTPEPEFIAAIEAFQTDLPGRTWTPDGKITVGGPTWQALHAGMPATSSGQGNPRDNSDSAAPGPGDSPNVDPNPSADAPRKTDPKRTIYSLLMHVAPEPLDTALLTRVPWLAQVALGDAEQAHREDAAEARSGLTNGRLPTAVVPNIEQGTIEGSPAAIAWVQRRLARLTDYRGPTDGTVSGVEDVRALQDALRAFQEEHTSWYRNKRHRPAPGKVNAEGDTVKALKKTRRELKLEDKAIDPAFVDKASAPGPTGAAAVLTDLAVPIRAGDVLWRSGQATGVDAAGVPRLLDQVHWELFSTEPIVGPWKKLEDTDQDLTADVDQKILDAIERFDDGVVFRRDGRINQAEIVGFYAMTDRSRFLRTMQCRFRSEWAVDLDAAMARLDGLGYVTDGLADALAPYMWWPEVADAGLLPVDPLVWHYNPIEFAAFYQEQLDVLAPAAPPPVVAPEDRTHLRVRVLFANDSPWASAPVAVAAEGKVVAVEPTERSGWVAFPALAPDAYAVWIDGVDGVGAAIELAPGQRRELVLRSPIDGPEVTTGTLHVRVVDAQGAALSDVAVELHVADATPYRDTTATDGTVFFEAVQPEIYDVVARGVGTLTVDIAASSTSEIELRRPDVGRADVLVTDTLGDPQAGVEVHLRQGETRVTWQRTDAQGFASFEKLIAGDYDIYLANEADPTAVLEINERATTSATVSLLDPTTQPGSIVVHVHAADGTIAPTGTTVTLYDDESHAVRTDPTDEDGVVTFKDIYPGQYAVSVEQGVADMVVDLAGGQTYWTSLKLKPPAKGQLWVSVIASGDSGSVMGTLHVSDGRRVVASKVHFAGITKFDGLPPSLYRVYLEGYDGHGVDIDLPRDAIVPVTLVISA